MIRTVLHVVPLVHFFCNPEIHFIMFVQTTVHVCMLPTHKKNWLQYMDIYMHISIKGKITTIYQVDDC